MPLDELAASFMLEQDVHRRKNYPYIYFCPICIRSYLSKEKQDTCKFCAGSARLVTGGKMYVYFCPSCDARTESDVPKSMCGTCGKKILTLYRWDMLQKRERRRIKAARFFGSLNAMKPKISIKLHSYTKTEKPVIMRKIEQEDKRKGEELPSNT